MHRSQLAIPKEELYVDAKVQLQTQEMELVLMHVQNYFGRSYFYLYGNFTRNGHERSSEESKVSHELNTL